LSPIRGPARPEKPPAAPPVENTPRLRAAYPRD
jgi:hypothetical protein